MKRREFLSLFTKGIGCYSVAATLPFSTSILTEENTGVYHFPQGVASGDPTDDSIVFWTRVERINGGNRDIKVRCQVAKDTEFRSLVADKVMMATEASDFTVRLICTNLSPDTKYYYRFIAGGDVSDLIGETRTAPDPTVARNVKFAFASCQSYEGGFYSAYRTLINQDKAAAEGEKIDFVVHLGDFIYETLGYGSARKLPDFPSGGGSTGEDVDWASKHAVTLEDYRHLYKNYLMDPDLKEARARWPFMVIWDDHEFTDDSWQGMSTYEIGGKPAQERKYAANQAWFEFIPAHLSGHPSESGAHDFKKADVENAAFGEFNEEGINQEPNNLAAINSLKIYRNNRWGKLLELVLTDSRSYRTPHAIPGEINNQISGSARYLSPLPLVQIYDAGKTYNDGNPPEQIPMGATAIPNTRKDFPAGSMLGTEQKAWWKEVMSNSDAKWKVWGHSVPVMPMRLDLEQVNPEATTTVFTIDTWDGYHTERRELMGFIKENNINNFVSIAGDNHNSFAGILDVNYENEELVPIGAEFSICGISSTSVFKALAGFVPDDNPLKPLVTYDATKFGGSDAMVPNMNMTFMHGSKSAATAATTGNVEMAKAAKNPKQNPHLKYVDSSAYGIGVVTVTSEKVTTDFITIEEPVKETGEEGGNVLRTTNFELPEWAPGEESKLSDPQFEGTPPFPFNA